MKKKKYTPVKTIVKRSKPGRGLGLFAGEPIKKGQFVVEYRGKKVPDNIADTLGTKYLFELGNGWTIDGSNKRWGNDARYINHSCDPNCETEIDEDDRIIITALCDIEKGEELTYDYGEEYFDEFIKPKGCKCDSCVVYK